MLAMAPATLAVPTLGRGRVTRLVGLGCLVNGNHHHARVGVCRNDINRTQSFQRLHLQLKGDCGLSDSLLVMVL